MLRIPQRASWSDRRDEASDDAEAVLTTVHFGPLLAALLVVLAAAAALTVKLLGRGRARDI